MALTAPTIDLKALQGVQTEALQDMGKVTSAPKREKGKNSLLKRPAISLRLHVDTLKAIHEHARENRQGFAELIRELIAIGMREKGIKHAEPAHE